MKRVDTKKETKTTAHSFEAKEFAYHEKNQFWYLGMGIILAAVLLLTLWSRDYLMSAVVLAVAVAVFRLSGLRPGSHKVEITSQGVHWGSRFLGFHQLKGFWLSEAAGQVQIHLDQLNLAPTITFSVPTTKIEPIVASLAEVLPYHAHKREPLSDRLNRLLRL